MRQKLTGQAFQVLQALLERPQEIITREELRERLWPGNTFVDYELALKKAVNRVREVLGDSAESPHFIETVPRHGYRFIGPTDTLEEASVRPARGRERIWYLWLLGLTLTALFATLLLSNAGGWRDRLLSRYRVPPIRSIAVLPLDNLSGDPGQEYFADGITDAVITELGKIGALRVISRQSVMRYKGSKKPLPEIARELGVEALIEGSIVRDGHRVAVTANLIDASSEKHIWSERYDRDLVDILAVQSDFAQSIAREVRAKLTPSERARFGSEHAVNPDAYELYLKGQYFVRKGTEEGRRRGVRYFVQAIEIDPNNALPMRELLKPTRR